MKETNNEEFKGIVPEGFTHVESVKTNFFDEIKIGEIYQAKIVAADERGILLSMPNGANEFMDTEELLVDYEKVGGVQPRYLNGHDIYVKVLDIDENGMKVSRKAALNELKEKLKATLKIGDTVVAKVIGFSNNVAFFDLGGYHGILPITEYSWSFTHSFYSIGRESGIKIGAFIRLIVKEFKVNQEGIEQVVLSRKLLYPNPWIKLEKILAPEPEIVEQIQSGKWKANRQQLKLDYKRARTQREKDLISKKIRDFDLKLPRVEGTYMGEIESKNGKAGSALVEIYKDPFSGDAIMGRALIPSIKVAPGTKIQYIITEFNPSNKTIFGVIKNIPSKN